MVQEKNDRCRSRADRRRSWWMRANLERARDGGPPLEDLLLRRASGAGGQQPLLRPCVQLIDSLFLFEFGLLV
jgi:hypothetical protein